LNGSVLVAAAAMLLDFVSKAPFPVAEASGLNFDGSDVISIRSSNRPKASLYLLIKSG